MSSDRRDCRRALAAAFALALTAAAGCGKVGPPVPPLRQVPAPVKDLVIRQRGNRLLFSFSYPQTTPSGKSLGTVTKVEIVEFDIPAPELPKVKTKKSDAKTPAGSGSTAAGGPGSGSGSAAAGGSGSTAGSGSGGTTANGAGGTAGSGSGTTAAGGSGSGSGTTALARPTFAPEAMDTKQYTKEAKVKLTVSGKDIGAATIGERLVIDMPLPEKLAAAGATPDFAVRTFGPNGDVSEASNQVLLVPQATTPASPAQVTVTAQADGIAVEWQPVSDTGGYAVYRRDAKARFGVEALAVVKPPEVKYFDASASYGHDYIYSVTALDPKQPLIESSAKSETEVHYVDKYPPPVPADLVAVAESDKVRLVWRQSEASDLSGYILYRKGATGDFARITAQPISGTTFVDATAASGQSYEYRVTAIDQVGNESAPSPEVRVAVP